MSDLIIRRAISADAADIVDLLNEIIALGGTTANQTPWTPQGMLAKMETNADRSAWFVATVDGRLMGYQYFQPHHLLPAEAPSIATFVRVGAVKMGIGSALFKETVKAAKELGYVWINATILEYNAGGHAYYTSRGFKVWDIDDNATLDDGTAVTKISRRYDIT